MQDLGQKIRMVVMAHRRIKIVNAVTEEDTETTVAAETAAGTQQIQHMPLTPPASPTPTEPSEKASDQSADQSKISGVFTVETENIVHQEYKTTDEIKALTQEVIKTIRDIIVSNQKYKFL